MRKIIATIILALAAWVPAFATSATVSGSNVQYPISFPLATGQWCFNSTCLTVTNGSFSGTVTEATATVTVTNGGAVTYLTVPSVPITSTPFNWNTYAVPSGVTATGMGVPSIACVAGALYQRTDTAAPLTYTCITVSGTPTWVQGLPPAVLPSGLYAGTAVPSQSCVSPCVYTLTNVSLPTAALYAIIAPSGTISSNWVLQSSSFAGGTAFTVTSGCGTTGTVSGGTLAGKFTAGATSCVPVITPGITAPNGFACTLVDLTTPADLLHQTATTATTATFSGTVVSADVLQLNCTAY